MKNFISDYREMFLLALIYAAIVVGISGVAYHVRGGQPWAYSNNTPQPVAAVIVK